MQDKGRPTSIKALIQQLGPDQPGLLVGTVKALSPLSITLVGEEKIELTDTNCVILDYLRDQKVEVSFSGTASGSVSTPKGDGSIKNITYKGYMTIKQGLKIGDSVHVLSLNEGRQYVVLGRV